MLNDLNKNIKTIVKLFPENYFNITSKTTIYFGLALYWCVIIVGTVLNII